MASSTATTFLKTAELAAIKAGDFIKNMRGELDLAKFKLGDDYKEGARSLKAKADFESQRVIINTLNQAFPDFAILSEERGYNSPSKNPEYTWIVDPLHDTIAYTRGNWPEFSVMIALAHHEEIIAGVIYQPVLKRLYTAQKGQGAHLNGQPIQVSRLDTIADCNMSIQHNALRYGNPEQIVKFAHKVRRLYALGSAMFGELSQGQVDVVLSYKQPLYDYAASKIILEEAGGMITQFNGEPVPIVFDNEVRTSVVATNSVLHNTIMSALVER